MEYLLDNIIRESVLRVEYLLDNIIRESKKKELDLIFILSSNKL